jgi:hypothetical protein
LLDEVIIPFDIQLNNALSITVRLLVHVKVLECSVVNTPSGKRVRKNQSEVFGQLG